MFKQRFFVKKNRINYLQISHWVSVTWIAFCTILLLRYFLMTELSVQGGSSFSFLNLKALHKFHKSFLIINTKILRSQFEWSQTTKWNLTACEGQPSPLTVTSNPWKYCCDRDSHVLSRFGLLDEYIRRINCTCSSHCCK